MSRTTYRSSQQFFDIPRQAVIGRDPNRVLRTTLFQCFVDFWIRKSGISPEPDFLTQLLQPLNLWQQELFPAVSAL